MKPRCAAVLLGPPGSGKTTLARIYGELVLFDGFDVLVD